MSSAVKRASVRLVGKGKGKGKSERGGGGSRRFSAIGAGPLQKRASLKSQSSATTAASSSGDEHDGPVVDSPELTLEAGMIKSSADALAQAERALFEFEALSRDTKGWAKVDELIESKRVRGTVAKRGLRVLRGMVRVDNMGAERLHGLVQTEEGMRLLDPYGEVLSMRPPVFGPFDLADRAGSVHVDYVRGLGLGNASKDLVLLTAYDNDNLSTVLVSCQYSGVPGASSYAQSAGSSGKAKGRTRSVHAVEYRCVPLNETSCFFVCTTFTDLCGMTTSAGNARRNKTNLKVLMARLTAFGDAAKNPKGRVPVRNE